jgi:2-keto-3-deoxy-6-phosphogluconate aldolase
MAARRGMVTMPGVFSPTEAFLALRSGASALKFFPASTMLSTSSGFTPRRMATSGRFTLGQRTGWVM